MAAYCLVVTAQWSATPFRRKLRADIAPLSTLKDSCSVQFVTKVWTMNASVQHNPEALGDYAGPPPILIAASSDEARVRAAAIADAGGYRTVAVPIENAVDRLDIQAAASAIWVELDSDGGTTLDRLLAGSTPNPTGCQPSSPRHRQ